MNDAERVHAPVRRGNGLRADDYVRVARPTTAIADAALDALRRTGIAARVTGPDELGRCELWADAHELDDVTTVLAAVVRHARADQDDLAPAGEEAVLAELAGDGRSDDGHIVLDDLDEGGRPDPAGTHNPTPSVRPYPTPARPRPHRRRTDLDSSSLADGDDVYDPEDHFRPDDPESLRSLSRTTVWALAILAVGVLALALSGLAPGIVGAYAPLASLLGTAAVLVGVGMLVTRLRDGRRDGDDDDRGGPNGDGAIL